MLTLFFSPILIIAAVVPAVVLLVYVYRKDRYDKESSSLLLRLVLFGIISTALASVTETIGLAVLGRVFEEGSVLYNFLLYFIVVALSEEGFKYLVLKKRTWKNPEFNCLFDGVIYAVFVSLGFALWENIGYVFQFGFGAAVVRALTAVPGHACFGVFMGTMYTTAKYYSLHGDEAKSAHYRRLSVIVPAILHGIYDFIASSEDGALSWLFIPFVIGLFIASVRRVRLLSAQDRPF